MSKNPTAPMSLKALKFRVNPELLKFVQANRISPREADVLAALASRIISNEDIAEALDLSPNTVSNHLKNIYSKTGTMNKAELMCFFADFCLTHLAVAKQYSRIPKVLFVDDDLDICEVISLQLTEFGLRVDTAGTVSQALDLYKDKHHDVVISDINMPDQNGFDLLRKLRLELNANPLVLFLTGYNQYTREQCMAAGACDFMEKPCNVSELYNRVMVNFIESYEDKARFQGVDQSQFENLNYSVLRRFAPEEAEIGHGGIFLPARDALPGSFQEMTGTFVKLPMQHRALASPVSILGQVLWVRPSWSGNCQPGLGIRFMYLSDQDREHLARAARASGTIAFIPSGEQTSGSARKVG